MTGPIPKHDVATHSVAPTQSTPGAAEPEPPLRYLVSLPAMSIRRSSIDQDMDLDDDYDEEHEQDHDEDVEDDEPAWGTEADDIAQNIVVWLRANDKGAQSSNYTVAVAGNTIYIAKVNGVTAKTALIGRLGAAIVQNTGDLEDDGVELRLCQRFNTAVGSNHAEMCVLAAIGEANIGNISYFACTEASCDYCAAVCTHYDIDNQSPKRDPKSQQGWTHPFLPWSFGTQNDNSHANQVKELTDLLDDGTKPNRAPLSVHPVRKSTPWKPA